MEDLGSWKPLSPGEAASVLQGLGVSWWIAGGWAIDAFLGHQTREHGDLDFAVLRRDQLVVREYLADWDLHAAVGNGQLRPWAVGDELPISVHDIWCRRDDSSGWNMQLMLEDAEDDTWLFRRDHRVQRPLASLVSTIDAIPYLSVEVQLLYKAREHNIDKNDADWRSSAAHLTPDQRTWLKTALKVAHPNHPWLASLEA